MISTRSYYSPDIAAEFCHPSVQNLPLNLPQPDHPSRHDRGNDDFDHRPSPSSETDGKACSGQTRRRVPVACQRCRKRKIKCSGDPGNGQGCSNCRSAGAAPNLCTFLRVNSKLCETYLSLRGVQGSGRYSPYPPNQSFSSRSGPLQLHAGNVPTNSYVNVGSGYDAYNGFYGGSVPRTGGCPSFAINYEDETYHGQAPAYMLPNNEPILDTNSVFTSPASPRNWDVLSSSVRTNNPLCADPSPSGSMAVSNGSFPGNGVHFPSNSGEASSALSSFSGTSTTMAGSDRILPNPAMARSQQPGLATGGANSLDGLPASSSGYRSSVPWFGNDGMAGSNQSSGRVNSVSYGSTANSNGGSDPSTTNTQDSYPYLPVSQSSPSDNAKSVAAPSGATKIEAGRHMYDIITDHRSTGVSQEGTPSPDHSMGGTYGYSGDVVMSRRSAQASVSSGTLANGQEYTRLRPLPTPTSELYRTSQPDSSEYQSQVPHRTSIASLSNSTRY